MIILPSSQGFFRKQGGAVSGAKLILDASSVASYPGNGTVWYDISGNSNNFSIVQGAWNAAGYMDFKGSYGIAKNSANINLSGDVTYVVIADVCDKGIASALFMSVFRTLIRYTLLKYYSALNSTCDEMLADVISSVNHYMAITHESSMMFATVFIASYSYKNNSEIYNNLKNYKNFILNFHSENKNACALYLLPLMLLYIELLLTNTSLSFNVTTISRLSEDLSLMKSLFDELRIKVMLTSGNRHLGGSKVSRPQSQHTASNTVNDIISIKTTPMILSVEVIDNDDNDNGDDDGDNSEQGTSTTQTKTQKSKKKKKMFSLFKRSSKSQQNGEKPNTSPANGMGEYEGGTVEDEDEDELSPLPSVNSRNTAVVAPSSSSRLTLSSSGSSSSSSPAVVVTIGGSNHRAESDSKRMIRLILQPLSHLILALQMNSQYLPEFVQKELFEDFGISCVNIWLLIMNWRSESREEVSSTYTRVFKDWSPVTNEPPLIDISSYIIKVKNATMSK
jgi:hypothetical protein